MTVTYPLAFPSIGIASSYFRLHRVVAESTSPFTGAQQVVKHQGEWWAGEATFRLMTYNDSAAVKAFMAQLRGKFGTFLYGDPDNLAKGNRGTATSGVLVNGAGQTGNVINLDGFAISTENVLRAGDFIQLGTDLTSRLHMVTADVTSDGSGAAAVDIEPALRSSPADNAAVVTSGAKGLFRLTDNAAEWQSDFSCVTAITIAFKEVL